MPEKPISVPPVTQRIHGAGSQEGPETAFSIKKRNFGIKSGLPCPDRSENPINRKSIIFYIETVLNFFFQLRKIFFLRSISKKSDFFGKILKNRKMFDFFSTFF